MTDNKSGEETTIVAVYSSRRDAGVARERLEGEDIRAFITADDAGGAHPELQLANGVKLVVLSGSAQSAHKVLEDADMLPEPETDRARTEREENREEQPENLAISTDGLWGATSWGYILLFALLVAGILFGLVFSMFA